jgi:hypothetical protein
MQNCAELVHVVSRQVGTELFDQGIADRVRVAQSLALDQLKGRALRARECYVDVHGQPVERSSAELALTSADNPVQVQIRRCIELLLYEARVLDWYDPWR